MNNELPMPASGQRIDTLLALAHVFCERDSMRQGEATTDEDAAKLNRKIEPRRLLQGLSKSDRLACDARLKWHDALAHDEQARWLRHTLSRIRDTHPQLDSQIDASHILETLRGEPVRVQKLICAHLNASLAAAALAEQLNATHLADKHEPSAAVMRVVRHAFLRNFVSLQDLAAPTQLDALTPAELARTLRLLGVRETAFALRGITAVETVAAFVRRFDAVDARLIVARIATLVDTPPARITFAERLLERMIAQEVDSGALLDRTGLYALADALAAGDDASARYTEQKLPLEGARELRFLIQERRQTLAPEILRERQAEVELAAAEIRRITAHPATTSLISDDALADDEKMIAVEPENGDENTDTANR